MDNIKLVWHPYANKQVTKQNLNLREIWGHSTCSNSWYFFDFPIGSKISTLSGAEKILLFEEVLIYLYTLQSPVQDPGLNLEYSNFPS
jgi:hypothetical protein